MGATPPLRGTEWSVQFAAYKIDTEPTSVRQWGVQSRDHYKDAALRRAGAAAAAGASSRKPKPERAGLTEDDVDASTVERFMCGAASVAAFSGAAGRCRRRCRTQA